MSLLSPGGWQRALSSGCPHLSNYHLGVLRPSLSYKVDLVWSHTGCPLGTCIPRAPTLWAWSHKLYRRWVTTRYLYISMLGTMWPGLFLHSWVSWDLCPCSHHGDWLVGWVVVPASTKLPFPPHHHVVRQGDQPANLIISANKQTLGEHQIRSHGTLGH